MDNWDLHEISRVAAILFVLIQSNPQFNENMSLEECWHKTILPNDQADPAHLKVVKFGRLLDCRASDKVLYDPELIGLYFCRGTLHTLCFTFEHRNYSTPVPKKYDSGSDLSKIQQAYDELKLEKKDDVMLPKLATIRMCFTECLPETGILVLWRSQTASYVGSFIATLGKWKNITKLILKDFYWSEPLVDFFNMCVNLSTLEMSSMLIRDGMQCFTFCVIFVLTPYQFMCSLHFIVGQRGERQLAELELMVSRLNLKSLEISNIDLEAILSMQRHPFDISVTLHSTYDRKLQRSIASPKKGTFRGSRKRVIQGLSCLRAFLKSRTLDTLILHGWASCDDTIQLLFGLFDLKVPCYLDRLVLTGSSHHDRTKNNGMLGLMQAFAKKSEDTEANPPKIAVKVTGLNEEKSVVNIRAFTVKSIEIDALAYWFFEKQKFNNCVHDSDEITQIILKFLNAICPRTLRLSVQCSQTTLLALAKVLTFLRDSELYCRRLIVNVSVDMSNAHSFCGYALLYCIQNAPQLICIKFADLFDIAWGELITSDHSWHSGVSPTYYRAQLKHCLTNLIKADQFPNFVSENDGNWVWRGQDIVGYIAIIS